MVSVVGFDLVVDGAVTVTLWKFDRRDNKYKYGNQYDIIYFK